MNYNNVISYNKRSAAKYSWDPSWFKAKDFNKEFIDNVILYQKEHNLTQDALVGPSTYRRVFLEREATISDHRPSRRTSCRKSNHIVHNSKMFPIEWDKVILWDEKAGHSAKAGNYSDYSGKPNRKPKIFVNHWDVCLSSESCAKVLNKRGISVHFLIDNDGTIYQTLDTQHAAWHAGNINRKSIGVEIANAYYPKYQNWYESNGYGKRAIVENAVVNGHTLEPHLDFYPIQIQALKALWVAISKACNIPLHGPESSNTNFLTSTNTEKIVSNGTFKGFVSHYHQTTRKIDCGGLDIVKILNEIKNGKC
jgi:hypothetical protein